MGNTYAQITIQTVFAVKNRDAVIGRPWRDDLHGYVCGTLRNFAKPLAVGGWKDHIHVLFGMNAGDRISDIVQKVKSNSSKGVNEGRFLRGRFEWQSGFGAFSYSKDQRDRLIKYIMIQEEHHRVTTFREEYLKMLQEFEVEYDDRYLFEFFD
jgi:putative transposase